MQKETDPTVEFEPLVLDTWRARWIWSADAQSYPGYVYFRKTVELNQAPQQAQLFLSANTEYKLYVNGSFLGRGPDRCDPAWKYYDGYDLAGRLRPGPNQLAVLVYHLEMDQEQRTRSNRGRGALIVDLRMEMPGGRRRDDPSGGRARDHSGHRLWNGPTLSAQPASRRWWLRRRVQRRDLPGHRVDRSGAR